MSERAQANTCLVLAAVCLAMLWLVSFHAGKASTRPVTHQLACSIA
jgi:hypothetical protein